MNDLILRAAEVDDTQLLLSLIRELAEAEAFPFPVTVTEGDLRHSLFGTHPAAEAVLGFVADQPVGFAVFYETFATTTGRRGLHLDDLFVRAEHQGKGFGRALLWHVAGPQGVEAVLDSNGGASERMTMPSASIKRWVHVPSRSYSFSGWTKHLWRSWPRAPSNPDSGVLGGDQVGQWCRS